jgi:serine/threonine-protein kinase
MPPYTSPRNLRDLLRTEPRLEPTHVARLLGEVAAALAPRHARGEAHGALTPERVLLDAGGRASIAPPPADDGGALAPWPAYLAPEQIDGRPPEPHSDVYALGLLGWEMLAGQPPWAGESLYSVVLKQRQQDLPRLSTLRPGLPRSLVFAIEGALHKSPGDRWRDADEMLSQLGRDGHGVATSAGALADTVPAVAAVAPTAAAHAAPPPFEREPSRARPVVEGPILPVDPEPVGARAVPPAPARRSRMRPLGLAALALAVLGAGAAGLAVVQGREEKGSTQAWLDSISAGGATGEVISESTLTVAEEMARDRARRDSLARRNRAAAEQARRDSAEAAAAAADSAQGSADTAAPRDTVAPPDTAPPPPTTRPATPAPVPNPSPAPPLPPGTTPGTTPSPTPGTTPGDAR